MRREAPDGRKRKVHLTHEQVDRLLATWCARCRKVAHLKKAGARNARKLTPSGDHLSIYRCPSGSGLFHIGKLPGVVRRGEISKDEFYGGRYARDRQGETAGDGDVRAEGGAVG